jgi:hypothetical protein
VLEHQFYTVHHSSGGLVAQASQEHYHLHCQKNSSVNDQGMIIHSQAQALQVAPPAYNEETISIIIILMNIWIKRNENTTNFFKLFQIFLHQHCPGCCPFMVHHLIL